MALESFYVLDEGGQPVLESDQQVWLSWFERTDLGVARTAVTADITVLTTFRGVDDRPEQDDAPPLFETRVFGGPLDGEEKRYLTRADALAGHARLVEWCRIGSESESCVGEYNQA